MEKAARLMMLVAGASDQGATPKELAAGANLALPTTYHLLNTLNDTRLLTRTNDGRYFFGSAMGFIAEAYGRQTLIPDELMRPLHDLIEQTGESAYLSAWRQGKLEVLAHLDGTRAVRVVALQPGFHGAAHARASGKVLLAFGPEGVRSRYLADSLVALTPRTITDSTEFQNELGRVLAQGYAEEHEEFCEGVACVSVPLIADGLLLGAYTVSAPVERYQSNRDEYLEQLLEAAAAAAGAHEMTVAAGTESGD